MWDEWKSDGRLQITRWELGRRLGKVPQGKISQRWRCEFCEIVQQKIGTLGQSVRRNKCGMSGKVMVACKSQGGS